MGVAIPSRWIVVLTGLKERPAQLYSYFATPLLLLAILPLVCSYFAGSHCLVQSWLGISCPGCGVTRSMVSLLHGDVAAAWAFNPSGILVLAALVGQSVVAALELISPRRFAMSLRYALVSQSVVMTTAVLVWLIRVLIPLN